MQNCARAPKASASFEFFHGADRQRGANRASHRRGDRAVCSSDAPRRGRADARAGSPVLEARGDISTAPSCLSLKGLRPIARSTIATPWEVEREQPRRFATNSEVREQANLDTAWRNHRRGKV